VCTADGETYVLSAEVAEARYPILVEQFALYPARAGHGQWRGGLGIAKDYRILNSSAQLTASFGRSRFPPWGLAGGGEGSPNRVEVTHPDGRTETRGRFSNERATRGTLVRFITGTGGGYGDPKERDPEKVLEDLLDEYITAEDAERIYGVALTPGGCGIDWNRTGQLRAEGKR
jgi:N-methylhydantoinase B